MRIAITKKIRLNKVNLACIGLFLYLTKGVVNTALLYLVHTPTSFNAWVAILLMYTPIFIIPFVDGKRRKVGSFFLLWICVFLVCMVTYLFHPEYREWLFEGEFNVWTAIFRPDQAIYLFLFIRMVDDPKKLLQTLRRAGFVLIAYNIYKLVYAELVRGYWVATGVNRGISGSEYNLGFGYDILLLFILFIVLWREEKKWYYILFSGAALACILLAGSRGPLLGVALVFLVGLFDRIRNRSMVQRVILMGIFTAVMLIVIINLSNIMLGIGLLLQRMGISSRTITMLAAGNYNDNSGRSTLWEIALELIRTGGPFGHGIYGDRYVISARTSMWIGYCHNILLEILVDFGYLL